MDKTFVEFNLTYLIIHLHPSLRVERTGGVVQNRWFPMMMCNHDHDKENYLSSRVNECRWNNAQSMSKGGKFHLGKNPKEWNEQH